MSITLTEGTSKSVLSDWLKAHKRVLYQIDWRHTKNCVLLDWLKTHTKNVFYQTDWRHLKKCSIRLTEGT